MRNLPIGEAFEKGQLARDVRMDPDGRAVILYDRNLIEDDGQGARNAYPGWPAPHARVRGDEMARKVFDVPRPGACNARLVVCTRPFPGERAVLRVAFNGTELPTGGRLNHGSWRIIPVPVELLKAGANDAVFSCRGRVGWQIGLADRVDILRNAPELADQPPRSFRSVDGGRRWSRRIGERGELRGELMVRLSLEQYAARGQLIGPVIDLARKGRADGPMHPVRVRSVRVRADADLPPRTGVRLELRSGTTPVHGRSGWGRWMRVGEDGTVAGPLQRFVQWRATLRTSDPTVTPALRAVRVAPDVDVRPVAWAEKVKRSGCRNEEILYTSIPFEYERFDEPQLVELRRKYALDDVVAGAKTEMEKMIRLRHWVATQWSWTPPGRPYPAWDAREIIERKDGMCVQFAIAYMQCALSLGMQTRFVFGDFPQTRVKGKPVAGHEVNEFWSNEYGKWIYMDANQDECFVAAESGVPVSMLEFHDELMDLYFGKKPMVLEWKDLRSMRRSKALRMWKRLEPAPRKSRPVMRSKWGCVRWMPRNNFYAHRFPEPIDQGRTTWAWSDYWQWWDERTPRMWQVNHCIRRESDVHWTINQVRWAAEWGRRKGTVEVVMGTVTPDFDTYLVSIDGGEWRPSGETLTWKLHPGRNRLQMRVRNRAGVLGRVSRIALNYAP